MNGPQPRSGRTYVPNKGERAVKIDDKSWRTTGVVEIMKEGVVIARVYGPAVYRGQEARRRAEYVRDVIEQVEVSKKRKMLISTSSGDHIYISSTQPAIFQPYDPEVGEPPTLWFGGLGGSQWEFEDSEVTFEELPE